MKRLIALLIAILTLLFGGVRQADKPPEEPNAVTESVTELSAEKEKPDANDESEADHPDIITPSEPETAAYAIETPVEPVDEQTPGTDTFSSQLTEEDPVPEEQTEIPEPTTQTEQQAVIPLTPVTEETAPQKTKKKTENAVSTDTIPSSNAPVFVDPAQGGPNPFEIPTPTEIEDHPVDEFIGEGDDRPGEGIHF